MDILLSRFVVIGRCFYHVKQSGFQMTVKKPKPKQLLRPITTGADNTMNQSQFLAITCNSLKAREKSRVYGAIGFGFTSHWLKNWRESFKPITKRSNRNHVIIFDSHLKTDLSLRLRITLLLENTALFASERRADNKRIKNEQQSDFTQWFTSTAFSPKNENSFVLAAPSRVYKISKILFLNTSPPLT